MMNDKKLLLKVVDGCRCGSLKAYVSITDVLQCTGPVLPGMGKRSWMGVLTSKRSCWLSGSAQEVSYLSHRF